MTPEDSKQILGEVKTTLTDYQGKIETRVKELLAEGKGSSDKDVVAVKEELAKVNNAITQIQQQIKHIGVGLPGLAEALKKEKFSLTSMCKALYEIADPAIRSREPWKGAEFEKEVVDAYAKVRAADNAVAGTSGEQFIIPPEVQAQIVDLAMAAIPLVDKLPVTKIVGLRGDLPIPKLTGRPTAAWCGEDTAPASSKNTYGEIIGRPKRVAAFTRQSKRLLYQSRGVGDAIIQAQLVAGLQLKLHEGLLIGSGSEYQPKGIMEYLSQFTAGNLDLGANGGRFTLTDAAMQKMALEAANEGNDNPNNYGYLMRPEVKFGMLTERTQQFSGQGVKRGQPVAAPLLSEGMLKELIGNFATTTQIDATGAKGASSTLAKTVFGNWQHFWVMFWEGMAIRVSDQASDGAGGSAFTQNQVYIIAEQEVDCACVRPTAFTCEQYCETRPTSWQ